MSHTTIHEQAAMWARGLLAREDWVILDTETTGLDRRAEIAQIAVIDRAGTVLLDTLVKPTIAIPARATAIHGITDAMVSDAPSWTDVLSGLGQCTTGRTVVIYNAPYDLGVIEHCCALAQRSSGLIESFSDVACAMRQYARWVGEWDSRRGSYRWQPLPGGDHTALGDARATLAVIKRMAGQE